MAAVGAPENKIMRFGLRDFSVRGHIEKSWFCIRWIQNQVAKLVLYLSVRNDHASTTSSSSSHIRSGVPSHSVHNDHASTTSSSSSQVLSLVAVPKFLPRFAQSHV